jgi:hypothetical protein
MIVTMDSQHFIVRRDDPTEHEAVTQVRAPLAANTVEFRIDRFGFTSINMAYARQGDPLHFWEFFPTPRDGWGRIPTWGFATVVRSTTRAISIGERYYGCVPMSSHLVVQPDRIHPGGFYDASPHRRDLSQIYLHYLRTTQDPGYRADSEFQQVVLRRLFVNSFYLADFVHEKEFFGADTAVVSCASSKLALGMAFLLAPRRDRRQLVALTAARNVGYVTRLGLYDRVVAYDDLGALPAARRVLLVDIAGGTAVRGAVHRQYGAALTRLISVGSTHGAWHSAPDDIPGVEATRFFAPTWMDERRAQWTVAGAQRRVADAWDAFLVPLQDLSRHWMTIASCIGPDAVRRTYDEIIGNRARPDLGHVLSL